MAEARASLPERIRNKAERAPVATTAIVTLGFLAARVPYVALVAPELLERGWIGSGGWYSEIVRGLLLAYTPILTLLSRRSALDALEALDRATDGGSQSLQREVSEGGSQLRVMGAVAGIAFGLWLTFGAIAPHVGVLTEGASRIAQIWDVV